MGVIFVFIFHCTGFFSEYLRIRAPEGIGLAQLFLQMLIQWMMPLMFIISGASIAFGYQPGQPGSYIVGKVKRLLVPFLFGTAILIPPQIYFERISQGRFAGTFFEFIPHYFEGIYGLTPDGNFAWSGRHLWYLLFLFIFTIILMPLFSKLKSLGGQRTLTKAVTWLQKPGLLYSLFLPIAILVLPIDPVSAAGRFLHSFGGLPLFVYIIYFLYGYVIFSVDAMRKSIIRQRYISLFLSVGLTRVLVFLLTSGYQFPSGIWKYALLVVLQSAYAWCILLTLFAFSMKYMDFHNRFLTYANEAVLPFYVLHPLVLIVGFFVLQMPLILVVQYILILIMTFIITLALYEMIIRRINLTRFLLGMKLLN